jgi:hypothetical protein
MSRSWPRQTKCNVQIGTAEGGYGIFCDKPRCEEAGRRVLCFEHLTALQKERDQRRRTKQRAMLAIAFGGETSGRPGEGASGARGKPS